MSNWPAPIEPGSIQWWTNWLNCDWQQQLRQLPPHYSNWMSAVCHRSRSLWHAISNRFWHVVNCCLCCVQSNQFIWLCEIWRIFTPFCCCCCCSVCEFARARKITKWNDEYRSAWNIQFDLLNNTQWFTERHSQYIQMKRWRCRRNAQIHYQNMRKRSQKPQFICWM